MTAYKKRIRSSLDAIWRRLEEDATRSGFSHSDVLCLFDRLRVIETRLGRTGVPLFWYDVTFTCGNVVRVTAVSVADALGRVQAAAHLKEHGDVQSVILAQVAPCDLVK